jgi:hypothetical protein
MDGVKAFGTRAGLARHRGMLLLITASLAVFLFIAFNPAIFNDGDTSWHLATGRLILARGAVPGTDPFSFTFTGAEWTAHEWLAEVLMAGALSLGGWSALAILTAASVAALLFLIGNEAKRFLPSAGALAVIVGVAAVLAPFIVARPHVLAWPVLAGWTIALLRAREREMAPPFFVVPIMLIWANLHGSFLFGLLLVGFFGLEALISSADRMTSFRRWALFGFASLAASLVTPHGVQALLFPLEVSRMESLPLIGEWRRTNLAQTPAFAIIVGGAAVLVLHRKVRVPLLRLLLIALLLYLAMAHVRHQAVLAIVGALVLIPAFAKEERLSQRMSMTAWAIAGVALAALTAVRFALPIDRHDSASNPLSAIAHVPAELRDQPVLNSYAFGGPLILNGVRPYIDGRADMYGDAFMFLHHRMMQGDLAAFRRESERWGLRWTILSPLDPLSRALDGESGWRRIHTDEWAVVHVAE